MTTVTVVMKTIISCAELVGRGTLESLKAHFVRSGRGALWVFEPQALRQIRGSWAYVCCTVMA